jgi:hypothetical protein
METVNSSIQINQFIKVHSFMISTMDREHLPGLTAANGLELGRLVKKMEKAL